MAVVGVLADRPGPRRHLGRLHRPQPAGRHDHRRASSPCASRSRAAARRGDPRRRPHRHDLGRGINAAIIVFAKLNPVIVTLATNFIGLAALFLVFQLAEVPRNTDIYHFRPRQIFSACRRSAGRCWSLVLVVGFLVPRTTLRPPRHRRRRQSRRRQGARHLAAGSRASPSSWRPAASSALPRCCSPATSRAVQSGLRQWPAAQHHRRRSSSRASRSAAGAAISGCCCSRSGSSRPFRPRWCSSGLSSDTQSIFQGFILVIAVRHRRVPRAEGRTP